MGFPTPATFARIFGFGKEKKKKDRKKREKKEKDEMKVKL